MCNASPSPTPACQARAVGHLAVAGLALLCGGCSGGILDPAGPVGGAERKILLDALAIMLAIVIPTIVATLAVAWWYRASNERARYRPNFVYSGRLELIIWSIPALVIFFLGGIAWIGSHQLDPAEPLPATHHEPIDIEVVALDWKWLFIYPQQGLASVNRMVIPAGAPLRLRITSATVLNVFFVPRLGTMIYAMYGMSSQLNLQADELGSYLGEAAHFNGDGFSDMRFEVRTVTPVQFDTWARDSRASGPSLDSSSYRLLLRQSQNVAPYTYRSVQPDLFETILHQQLPPGEGPSSGHPGTDIRPTRD